MLKKRQDKVQSSLKYKTVDDSTDSAAGGAERGLEGGGGVSE